jgi:hypothetical protein
MTATLAAPDLAAAAEAVTASAGSATLPAPGMARLVAYASDSYMQAKGTEVQATSMFATTLVDEGIELYVPAKVSGTLQAPEVFMDKGVQFSGSCTMAPID